MARNEKYHFIYTGFYSGTFNFETILRNETNNTARWTVYIEPDSFQSSCVKIGVFNYIIKGHVEDDSSNTKRYFFYVSKDKNVVVGTRENMLSEVCDRLPIPKYMCDFFRVLINRIEEQEVAEVKSRITVGDVFET